MKTIYYDTETTGVRPDKDAIVEIAAYDPEGRREFVAFVNPGMPIPQEAAAIHGITDEMVKEAPDFATVGQKFKEFCTNDAVLIAHNNDRFDKLFLHHEAIKHELLWPEGWIHLDSLLWARKYRPDLPKHSLQFLREVYGFAANKAHRALDDVIILEKVFSAMIGDLSIETVIELLQDSKKVSHMPFGKHRGKLLAEVPKDYLSWLSKSGALDKGENEALKVALEEKGLV